jgi:hypothetical protein
VTAKRWIGAVLLFFAWGFAMHASGLLLHEFGGHALTATIFGCGIDDYALTFFGHGQVTRASCEDWTFTRVIIVDWSGLVVTTSVGVGAIWLLRRRKFPPFWRVLISLVGFFFLLGQLGYATTGGFHDLYDPRRSAQWLGRHGLHVLAWFPTLIAYAVSGAVCARLAVDSFREHFGIKTRLQTIGYLLSTLGVAGILYFVAFRIEWQIRTDLEMRGVEVKAIEIAREQHTAPPFPIDKVLLALAAGGLIWALARPIAKPTTPKEWPKRLPAIVALTAAGWFLVVFVLIIAK